MSMRKQTLFFYLILSLLVPNSIWAGDDWADKDTPPPQGKKRKGEASEESSEKPPQKKARSENDPWLSERPAKLGDIETMLSQLGEVAEKMEKTPINDYLKENYPGYLLESAGTDKNADEIAFMFLNANKRFALDHLIFMPRCNWTLWHDSIRNLVRPVMDALYPNNSEEVRKAIQIYDQVPE